MALGGYLAGSPPHHHPAWVVGGVVGVAGGAPLVRARVAFGRVGRAGGGAVGAAAARLAQRCGGASRTFVRLAVISPLVLVHVVSGAHNDILLAALVLTGLAIAAHRQRPGLGIVLAGVAFGLAAGIKVTALVAAPFAIPLLLGPASTRRPVT